MKKILLAFATFMICFMPQLHATIHMNNNVSQKDFEKLYPAFNAYANYIKPYDINIVHNRQSMAEADNPLDGTTPYIIISDDFLRSTSQNEINFVMAHELSHLLLHHHEKIDKTVHKIMNNPISESGMTFIPWNIKIKEEQADLNGQKLYLEAGFSSDLFYKEKPNHPCKYKDLDPRDTHYSFDTRWKILQNGDYYRSIYLSPALLE